MTIVLIVSLFTVPWEIAFGVHGHKKDSDTQELYHKYLDLAFDVFFFMDLIITFSVAIVTDDFIIIDDRKGIARYYLRGWFSVDFLSMIPYGLVAELIFTP